MLYRSFLPVGQGAFYLEEFRTVHNKKINIIYDCGSQTNKKIVESEIRNNFCKNEEILIVFISHLDADHVNGLEYLLKYCKVKNIVFPYTSHTSRYILSIKYLCSFDANNKEDFSYRLINNPYETILKNSDNTQIYTVLPIKEDFNSNEVINTDFTRVVHSGSNILEKIDFDKIIDTQKYWEYVPFNFSCEDRSKIFLEKLNNRISKVNPEYVSLPVESILEMWNNKSIQKAIKDAYDEVEGDLNANSMTLFSGAKIDGIYQEIAYSCNISKCYHKLFGLEKCPYHRGKANGCLYTGDYNANNERRWCELHKAYKEYWRYVGCIQIPHHGSYKSYNHELALFNSFYIISAGRDNKYRHPSSSVIKDLMFEGKHPFVVTEQPERRVIMEILL